MTEQMTIVRNKKDKNRDCMWKQIDPNTKRKEIKEKEMATAKKVKTIKRDKDELAAWAPWRTCWWRPAPLWSRRIWSWTCLSPGCRPSLSTGHPEEKMESDRLIHGRGAMIEQLWAEEKTGKKKCNGKRKNWERIERRERHAQTMQRERDRVHYFFQPARSVSVHAPASSSHNCGPPPTHQTQLQLPRHLGVFKQQTQTD